MGGIDKLSILKNEQFQRLLKRRARYAWSFALITFSSLVIFIGLAVWVEVFGFERPIFPSGYPALYAMLIAFFFIWVLSKTDKSERAGVDYDNFSEQEVRSQFGGEAL
jgi:cation/acetate symporter